MPAQPAVPTSEAEVPANDASETALLRGGKLTYSDCLKIKAMADQGLFSFPNNAAARVAILRNATIEPLTPVIVAELARSCFNASVHIGDFDTAASEALQADGGLYTFNPDVIVIFQWLEYASPNLARHYARLDEAGKTAALDDALSQVSSIVQAVSANSGAIVLVANAPLPAAPTLGILDPQLENGHLSAVLKYNARLAELARETSNVYVLDLMSIVARLGWDGAIDARMSAVAKAPFSQSALLAIGDRIGRFVRAVRGKTRKCLVLDCDNTLWGGIVGEDGPGGVKIGTAYPGSAFRTFQEEALNLASRGVLLAIASKNNHADVIEMLRDHDGMVLREEHFAVIKANWNDKAQSIREIAKELNIGLDSLVFVDDSQFEIDNIRSRLPEVGTIHLTAKPAEYAGLLADSGLFDSLSISAEDRERNAMYAAERKRAELAPAYDNIEDYLASLNLVADIAPVSAMEPQRVFQLMQKTNQFNLTTRRRTEGEIAALANGADSAVLRLRVRDKVSDLGLVGVAIVQYKDNAAEISDLLMSCRALGRGVEFAFLSHVSNVAFKRGAEVIRAEYRRTEKNSLCDGFLEKAGFHPVSKENDRQSWALSVTDAQPHPPTWVAIEGASK